MLFFIYDKLMNIEERDKLGFPLPFLTFSYIQPYKTYKDNSNETILAINYNEGMRGKNNDKVIGGIYLLDKRYLRYLDGYYGCSLSTFGVNSKHDRFHRVKIDTKPIEFSSLDNLSRLIYNDKEPIEVFTYLGNIQNKQVYNIIRQPRYRVNSGLDLANFLNQYKEMI